MPTYEVICDLGDGKTKAYVFSKNMERAKKRLGKLFGRVTIFNIKTSKKREVFY